MNDLKNIKVLVADDEYSNVDLILNYLKELTKNVYYAPNGKVAIELAEKTQPDIIIMDWQMPEMDGIEAIKELKKCEKTKDILIVMATGIMTKNENLQEALEAGAVDYLRKPYNPIEFKARLESALRIRNQHQTIQNMAQKEKDYVQKLYDQQARELSSLAMLDHQKNVLLDDLLQQIDRLDRITQYVHATEIASIKKKLRSQLDLSKSWDNFRLHFDQIHGDFFEKIGSRFPELSLNERKLSAYIKIGMGNFEISQMSGSSDAALRKAINRLKKKINLGPKDDVRKFFFEV